MSENARRPTRDQSTGKLSTQELTARLGDQMSRLVQAEIALAKGELTVSARQMVLGGGLLSGAAVTAMYALAVLIAAAVAAIALQLPVWAAALIIGGALLAVASVLALLGRLRLSEPGSRPGRAGRTTRPARGHGTVRGGGGGHRRCAGWPGAHHHGPGARDG